MCNIAINIPEEVMYDTRMSEQQAADYARQAVAISYYKNLGISLGYCAQIAGMQEESFIKLLGANGISIFRFDSKEEFLEELSNA